MIPMLDLLLELMKEERLLPASALSLSEEDADAILDACDSDDFSDEWVAAEQAVEDTPLGTAEAATVVKVREVAFRRVFNACKHPDLAAYISDDFGLIAGAAARSIEQPLITALAAEYAAGRIPTSEVRKTEITLTHVLEEAMNKGE